MLYAVLSTDIQNTLKYHLVTVKPSFTVEAIGQDLQEENWKG